jgi:hypothetical protein
VLLETVDSNNFCAREILFVLNKICFVKHRHAFVTLSYPIKPFIVHRINILIGNDLFWVIILYISRYI